ncbi:putative endo-beta-1,4-glucanase D, partial [Leucoagaricus sp. SymC.cos]
VDEGHNDYIRIVPSNNPVTDVTSTDLTCNVNGLSGSNAISAGHKGPVQVYVAKAPSTAASFNGQGAVWTKIYSSGKHSVMIPSSLPAGEYLLRAEIIALHVASSYPGAQFYIGCAQVKITGGGSASPPKISIPGTYKPTDPGITINIYNNPQSYTAPGGSVWSG